MATFRTSRCLIGSLFLVALLLGTWAHELSGQAAKSGTGDPFRLGARAGSSIAVNRVNYGLRVTGEIGFDSVGLNTVLGGFWPKGTRDGYMYGSGIQIVGIVAGPHGSTNPWGSDTSVALFQPGFEGSHAEAVTNIYRSFDPDDRPVWPDLARVPAGDADATLFHPSLQGQPAASEGDAYWIAWDGNPKPFARRPHPLGIVLEHRLLAWNYPAGNEDILYLVATAYNITSVLPADYQQVRPALREILLSKAAEFQAKNNATFNITLPVGGYTINEFQMGWWADPDVGISNRNSGGVNFPFGMGYAYQTDFFPSAIGWSFPPEIFSDPFFPGPGFVGAKFLQTPTGQGEITIYSTFPNSSTPSSAASLFTFYKGGGGGPSCNVAAPKVNHVCYIDGNATPRDLQIAQSAPATTLPPGGSATLVMAYIHAAPVKLAGYTPTANQYFGQQFIPASKVLWISRTDSMRKYGGVTRVDSLTGFQQYLGPNFDYFVNDTGRPDSVAHTPKQSEFKVLRGSLLDKARVAQLVFDNKFLLPVAPVTPEFFLIPGQEKVTVLWRPSATETAGDIYSAVAEQPNLANGNPNNLYDPNYRKFDVEGYRVYRGRSDNPSTLVLLQQFDYTGTIISDYGGNISRELTECAPELGQGDSLTYKCSRNWPGPITAGTPATVRRDFDLTTTTAASGNVVAGPIIQVLYGQRALLASGKLYFTAADTLMSSAYYVQMRGAGGVGYPALSNTGVPFVFVDSSRASCPACGVTNGVNYFYSVAAFDVNSLRSGPASMESSRETKVATVGSVAANFDNSFTARSRIVGRSVRTDDQLPTLDPVTGRFSKAFPPTNAMSIKLLSFIPQLLKGSGAVAVQLDSIGVPTLNNGATTSIAPYYLRVIPASGSGSLAVQSFPVTLSVTLNSASATGTASISTDSVSGGVTQGGAPFTAMKFDPSLVAVYGRAADGYAVTATWTMRRPRNDYVGSWGRGCASTTATVIPGFFFNVTPRCFYNGPRWYSGANESMNDPTGQTPWIFNPVLVPQAARRYGNAGKLDGVVTADFPSSYGMVGAGGWRSVEIALAHFVTAADYRVYWGAAGAIDSVIDLTHDLPVPFRTDMNASWGILNSTSVPQSMRYSRRDALTITDVSCVWPLKRYQEVNKARTLGVAFDSLDATGNLLGIPCQTPRADSANAALAIPLENHVVPGPIAFVNDTLNRVKRVDTAPRAANNGFLMYLKGRIFLFELAGGNVPAAGTQWNLRDYVGAISGGKGDAGDLGPYRFYGVALPFTAVGARAEFTFDVKNVVAKPSASALAQIRTVPDPYYVTSAYEASSTTKLIKFLNVPTGSRVRIYSTSGVLVQELQNSNAAHDGTVAWNVRNRSSKLVASGPYFWVVNGDGASQSGRMVIVNTTTGGN